MSTHAEPDDLLRSATAGERAARGGIARVAAFGAGSALTAAASAVLLRHLGVAAFGRYATVVALVTIAGGVADAGLTVVGQRAYVLAPAAERSRVLGTVAALRLILAPVAILGAAAFAVAVGHPREMVLGVLLAGAGVACSSLAVSFAIPLGARLRWQAVALAELARQAALAVAIVTLVVAGARLPALFAAQLVAGAAMLAATFAFVRGAAVPPRFDGRACLALARRAAAVGVALVLNIAYVRVMVVLVFLLGTGAEAGLFGTSTRVIELVGAVPWLLVGSAFPILVHAGAADEARLRAGLARLGEGGLVLACGVALVLGVGAEPVVRLLGGEAFTGATGVLRVQCLLVPALFLVQASAGALAAVDARRALVVLNAAGFAGVLVLAAVLIPPFGATGAAIAAVIAEWVLAAVAAALLARARPGLRPVSAAAWKAGVAAGIAVAAALGSGFGDVGATVLAVAAYIAVASILGAVPWALMRRSR